MARYVLKYKGTEPPRADIDLIEGSSEVTVIDHGAPQAMLIEAPERVAKELRGRLPDWVVAEEREYPAPRG